MQVYIHLDTSYMGRTCGLCGNYNNIQKDDYRTGNGMIARLPTTFANTWQSRKNCKPVPNLFIDPCTHSIQNEPFASFFCSKLQDQTEIFSACHSKVDVLNFYENCLFDACVCKNQQDCMCAALSSYVRACNEKGIHLDGWRTNLCDSYKNTCPESMEYQYLIETCQPTCKSLSVPDPSCIVNFTAIDGCVCKAGTYMKNPDECVEIDACPCYNMGSPVNPGDKVNKNEVTCTCIKGRLICEAREKYRIDCKPPMTYFNCSVEPEGSIGVECLRSCQTLNVDCYSIECISGCVCPGDLLADGTGSCVPSNKCTCIYNDKIYQHLETATIGCSLCTCKNRKWDCEKGEMLGVCTVYGEGNYITFDSRQYRYSGQCEYTLVQDFCGQEAMNGTFRVISENIPCGSSGTTCSKSIKVILDNYQLVLIQGEMHVTKSGNEFEAPFQTRNSGIYLIIEAKNGLILMWDKKTSIIIKLTEYFQDKVCGLCGNYDGNANNDFNTRGHCLVEDVIEFGNSWKLSPTCPEITYVKDPCEANPSRKPWAQRQCSIITSQTFQPCHSQVDPQKYYETCVKDACACDMGGDCDCFCTVVAIYAQACSEACACIDWRTPTICPVFCDYYNKDEQCEWHYKPCGANCMKTCRNPGGICLHELSKSEGCYPNCPEETPFFEEVGMNCVAQCGCYDQLGKYHRPGDTVNSCNNCETCNCTMRGIECTYDVKACYCDYNVHIYAYNEIIYQTYDGQGHCLTATCGVNGTIIKTINPCTTPHPQTTLKVSIPVKTTKVSRTTYCVSEKCAWSPWYDVSTPRKDKDGGDFETFYKIREKGYAVCEAPRDIRCRSKKYLGTPSEMGQIAICDISTGLVCLNKKQLKRFCYNYEIQFMCCEPVPCIEPTRVPTTTKPMPSGSSLFTASPSPSQTSAVTSQATSIKPFTVTQTISVSTPSVTYMTGKASSMITAPSTWSTATHITSEGSTTKCFCYVNGNSFSPGEVIYTKRGDDGCLVATICGKSCNIVIQKLPCETTAASATSVRTATATYTGTVTLPASSPSARITSPRSAQTWSPTVTYVSRSTSQATPGETTGPRTVSVSTTFPTKPCFCYVNGTYFSPGQVIDSREDKDGCVTVTICGPSCHVVKTKLPCKGSSTKAPVTSSRTPRATSARTTIATSVLTPTATSARRTIATSVLTPTATSARRTIATSVLTPTATSARRTTKATTSGSTSVSVPASTGTSTTLFTSGGLSMTSTQTSQLTSSAQCFCFYNGRYFKPGSVMYSGVDVEGCSYFGLCDEFCEIVLSISRCQTTAAVTRISTTAQSATPASIAVSRTTPPTATAKSVSVTTAKRTSVSTKAPTGTRRTTAVVFTLSVSATGPIKTPITATTRKITSASVETTKRTSISAKAPTGTHSTTFTTQALSSMSPTSSHTSMKTKPYSATLITVSPNTTVGPITTTPYHQKDLSRTTEPSKHTVTTPCFIAKCSPNGTIDIAFMNCPEVELITCESRLEPMKMFDNKGCCFYYECPSCVAPDGTGRKLGDLWTDNCKTCLCNEFTLQVICEPFFCATTTPATCNLPGYELIAVLTPSDRCCPEYECRCNPNLCPTPSTCSTGYETTVTRAGCCINVACVLKDVCVEDNFEYKPGSIVPSPPGSCEECNCTSMKDPQSQKNLVACQLLTCNKDCAPGQTYEVTTGECCGQCVQTACVVTTFSGSIQLLELGETWSPDNDTCTSYTCQKSQGQFSTVVMKRTCGDLKPEDCESGTIEKSPDGCCEICKAPKLCKRLFKTTVLQSGSCKATEDVPYCEGLCLSSSNYSPKNNKMDRNCQCCQEQTVEEQEVMLQCLDGTILLYPTTYVLSCGCEPVECIL